MEKQDLHKDSGFKTPKNYFETFEEDILDRTIRLGKNKISMPSNDQKHGFKIPENYFENIETAILSTITKEKQSKKIIQFIPWKKISYVASIAAVFALIVFLNKQTVIVNGIEDDIELVEASYLENYITRENLDISMIELEDFFNDENVELSVLETSSLSSETIYNYLNENIENELILIEHQ